MKDDYNHDTIYDGTDDKKVKDVVDDYNNDALNDANQTGNDSIDDAMGDYFNNLYGDGGNKNS